MNELKPCPLCDGKSVAIKINRTRYIVVCTKCFLIKPYNSERLRLKKEYVIDRWNRWLCEI